MAHRKLKPGESRHYPKPPEPTRHFVSPRVADEASAKTIARQSSGSQQRLIQALSDAGAVVLRAYPAPSYALAKDERRDLLQVHVRFPEGLIGYYSPGGPPRLWNYVFVAGSSPGDESLPGVPPDQISTVTTKSYSMREASSHVVAERKTKASDRIRLPDGTEMTLGEAFDAGLVTPTCSDYYDPPRYFARSKDGTVSWEIGKTFYLSRTGGVLPFKKSMREASSHIVADFNTLDDLLAHARGEGATHYIQIDDETHLYFQRKDGSYEKSEVWQKDGYWHTQGPGSRVIVKRPPSGAKAIGGAGGRVAEAFTKSQHHYVNGWNQIEKGIKVWVSGDEPTRVQISRDTKGREFAEHVVRSWWGSQALHFKWTDAQNADIGRDWTNVNRETSTVRDYIAVDPRDRQVAGPFKSYGDARKEADQAGGVVKFIPSKPRVKESPRRSAHHHPRSKR